MRPASLIPRRLLFENVEAFGGRLSPDGRWISWIAPYEGVLNIWIAEKDRPHDGQPLTRLKGRPIYVHEWTRDGAGVWFAKDANGDENWHIYFADVATRDVRDLTPLQGVNARVEFLSPHTPEKLLIALNDRDTRWHDLYLVDHRDGARELLWRNEQEYTRIWVDWSLTPRAASRARPGGGVSLFRLEEGAEIKWRDLDHVDSWSTMPTIFDRDGQRVLMRTTLGRDTTAFVWEDWKTGAGSVVAEDPRFDVGGYVLHPRTHEVRAVNVLRERGEWVVVDDSARSDFAFLDDRLPGFVTSVESQTDADDYWIVSAYKAESPQTTYLYDRKERALTELFRTRPKLAGHALAPMTALTLKSRDGLDLVSYLTLPARETPPKPAKPLPLVLLVHGGPWFRDVYGYNRVHQWLADRGYAVLSVNYRASWGFGKSFLAAGDHEHAGKMHDDLIDAVRWAVDERIADPDRVAIYGASYGGYAAFVGATFTPEIFRCAIPVVGISNLETLLATIPPYWAGFAEFMYRSYGDPRTPEGRALLAERSPIHRADHVARPMLILHGQNDVRCKIAESEAFVAAMQSKNLPVTFVVFPDEGHGFSKPQNEIAHVALVEAFLARHLGGAFEPFGVDLDSSSHEIRCGADGVAGA